MQGYARVMKHWARFGPDLEAAVCRVLRSVLEALKRKYPVPMPQPPAFLQQQQQYLQGPPGGGGQAGGPSFRAGPQGLGPQAEALRAWAEGQAGQVAGAMHRRTQSEMGTAAAAAIGAAAAAGGPHGAAGKRASAYMYSTNTPTMSPRGSEAGGAAAWQDAAYGVDVQGMQGLQGQMGWAAGGVRGGGGWGVAAGPLSMEVLHSEAVLLNSLKYFMVRAGGERQQGQRASRARAGRAAAAGATDCRANGRQGQRAAVGIEGQSQCSIQGGPMAFLRACHSSPVGRRD